MTSPDLTGVTPGEGIVLERTSTRCARRLAGSRDEPLVVTTDYRALAGNPSQGTSPIAVTSCGRHEALLRLMSQQRPTDAAQCLQHLDDGQVRMGITMPQMVFEARTGDCLLQIPRRRLEPRETLPRTGRSADDLAMHVLVTILGDGWLLMILLLSLMIAAWWGELTGIRPGRDKSGLGGFAAVYLFLPMRWLGLSILLPGWSWLAAHLGLGVLSVVGFERGLELVRTDRVVAAGLGYIGALLPVPAMLAAIARVHDFPITGPTGLVTGLGIAGAHTIPFLRWRAKLRRTRTTAVPGIAQGEPPFK
jgi:hypothetical protein